jgi:hypothetical protein
MATNQAGIPVIMQGTVNPPINQNQRTQQKSTEMIM